MKDNHRILLSVMAALALLSAGLVMIIPADDAHAEITTGSAGANAAWEYDDVTKVLTISGTGSMSNFSKSNNLGTGRAIETVVINEGITSIGNYAFYGCAALTGIILPEGLTSIGQYAFRGCTSLTKVTLPAGLTLMREYTFYGCAALTEITIPDSVTSIGSFAFHGCAALTEIILLEGLTSIGQSAFRGCTSLTEITIPDSVTSIGESAFDGCTSLTGITIPDGVTSIGESAFYECTKLETANVPSTASLGTNAFPATTNVILYDPSVIILSAQGYASVVIGETFSYTVLTNPAGAEISVSGASWLSVDGNTISGTADEVGTFTITVSADMEDYITGTQTFTLKVTPIQESGPTAGYIVAIGG